MPKIYFYQTISSKKPINAFFALLPDVKTETKILTMIQRLETVGHIMLKPPEAKKLTDNIWELRILYNKNAYRLLFFTQPNEIFVITHGFIKKTDKTPQNEIEKAENYRKDYLNQKEGV